MDFGPANDDCDAYIKEISLISPNNKIAVDKHYIDILARGGCLTQEIKSKLSRFDI